MPVGITTIPDGLDVYNTIQQQPTQFKSEDYLYLCYYFNKYACLFVCVSVYVGVCLSISLSVPKLSSSIGLLKLVSYLHLPSLGPGTTPGQGTALGTIPNEAPK